MRLLKLALITELVLGCIWTLTLIGMAPGNEIDMAALVLFVPVYLVHLPCMIAGAIHLFRRPETRPLAAAVLSVPIALLFLPALVRVAAGGPVTVHPAAWLALPGLPLATCLLLPHQVSEFLPRWTLRSRWLNLGTVVMLSAMVIPWAGLLIAAPATAHAAGGGGSGIGGNGGSSSADLYEALFDGPQAGFLLVVFAFAALSALIAFITLLTSYVGLFQREDRSQQKLRVAQLVLSIVVLAPALLVVAVGLVLVAIAATPLG